MLVSLASGSDNLLTLGERGDLGVDENIPPGVFVIEAIPPPGENKLYMVGDNHGSTE